jgi:hypothetical protein
VKNAGQPNKLLFGVAKNSFPVRVSSYCFMQK